MQELRITGSHFLQYGFFALLFGAAAFLSFQIVRPFLGIIFLAVILTVVFHPLYVRALAAFRGHRNLAALSTMLAVAALVVAPLVFFGYLLFVEASNLYSYLVSPEGVEWLSSTLFRVEDALAEWLPGAFSAGQGAGIAEPYAREALDWVVSNVGWLFSSFFKTFLFIVLTLLGFFHFLKDGERIADKLISLSPLPDEHDKMIVAKIGSAINAVIRGRLAMGAVQGTFAGIGFALFGVPNPVFFGFLTAFSSLVPAIGTALVLVPAVAYLFITGETGEGVGLSIWGAVAVGLVDDLISPYFIGRGIKLHPLVILVSVLGGIELFGLIGLIAGPVVVALFFVLVDIYGLVTRHVGGGEA